MMGVLSGFIGGGRGGRPAFNQTLVGRLAGGRKNPEQRAFSQQAGEFRALSQLRAEHGGRIPANLDPRLQDPLFGSLGGARRSGLTQQFQSESISRAAQNQTLLGQIFGDQSGSQSIRPRSRRAPSLLGSQTF